MSYDAKWDIARWDESLWDAIFGIFVPVRKPKFPVNILRQIKRLLEAETKQA